MEEHENAPELSPDRRELLKLLLAEEREIGDRDTIPRVARNGKPLEASFGQERLWFFDQLEPANALFNQSQALHLEGRLHVAALHQSLRAIVRRHEILRTSFEAVDGRPMQVIAAALDIPLPIVDLSDLSQAGQRVELQQRLEIESRQPFALDHAPLARLTLLRMGPELHVLLVTLHHIVADGWSHGVMVRELAAWYRLFAHGRGEPLAEPPLQYADYAAWQRRQADSPLWQEQVAYWKRQLRGELPVLELPLDHPSLPESSLRRGTRASFAVSPQVYAGLRELSRAGGVTLFVTLLTAFKVLLHRYSGQEDLLVVSPIAVRNRLELEGMIGFFVNSLALRTDLSGNPTFDQALQRVQQVCFDAFAHQELPFDKVVEEVRPNRSRGGQPLTPVSFMLHAAISERQDLGEGLSLVAGDADLNDEYTLTMVMWQGPDQLTGTLLYDATLFDAGTIERLVGHWQTLLAAIVAHPDSRVAYLPLLEEEERQQLLFGWNETRADYVQHACLHERFEKQVEATPDALALTCDDRHWTYRELNRQANQLAHYLRARGVEPEVPVALCTDRSAQMVIGLLGIVKAGGTYVPLDSDYPRARLEFMLQDSRSPLLVTQQHLLPKLPDDRPPVVLIDADWSLISQESEENPANRTAEDNAAYVIYTSGSTGRPKGTVVSHANVGRLFDATQDWFHFGPTDVWTLFHSLAFDFSVWEVWGPLLSGGRLVVVPYFVGRSPVSFYGLLREQRVTVLNQTPSAFRQIVQHEETAQSNDLALRLVIFGGEALDIKSLGPWFDRHGDRQPQLVNMYGITETTVHVTYRPLTTEDATTHRSVIGRPIPDLDVYLLDERLQPVPAGIPGELHVGGAGLSRGYFGHPELTAERFIPDPFSKIPGARLYKSGDLARRLPDGDVEYLGRIDHQVKIRGFRIELSEIEAVLHECAAVREAVVVAREDRPGEKRLVAYVVQHADGSDSPSVIQQLRDHLRRRLPEYMVPAAFILLDRLPLSSNGKIDRNALPPPDFSEVQSRSACVPPRSAVEQQVAEIWADVLAVDRFGVHDNFFELGGHSLLATQVISRTCQLFRVEIPLRLLFDAPTVAGLAEAIEAALGSGSLSLKIPPLQRMERVAPLPLSFAQQRLWFFDRLAPGNPFYNMSGVVRLTGRLDLDALERSLNEVVRRHEALRTTFIEIHGQPVQEIAPNLAVPFPFQDLQLLPEAEREAEAMRLARGEARRPFDLARGPLLRACVLKLAAEEHVVILCMHHIVSDGWSVGVFVREMMALYEAFSQGNPSPLAALPIQYVDFAIWQRQWLAGETLERQLSYWKKQLADVPTLQLPTDRPRPAVQTFRGETLPFDLSADLTEELRKLSRRAGVTLFMTMLAAFKALLFRCTDSEDILVGSPIANRNRGETEGLIGFFVNMLVLRTNLSGNPSFLELLGRVREVALEAYAHQDLPFERLVEELQPSRDTNRNPLFQVALALQNAPMPELESTDITLRILEAGTGTTKFDLTVFLWETPDGLSGTIEYSSDLFDPSTITRLLGYFTTVLRAIAATPEKRLGELPILSAAERRQILEEWNATRADHDGSGCVHHLIERQAEQRPDALAVAYGGLQLTYRELNERANGLAMALRQRGVGPEVVVALCMERSLELIVGMLAILKAGGAYLALDPSHPKARLTFLMEDSRASVLFTQKSLLAILPGFPQERLCVLEDAEAFSSSAPPRVGATEGNLAYVIYTSGSTGQPKGVAVSHHSLLNLIGWHRSTYDVSPEDRASQLAPLSFDASVWEIWPYLTSGASLHLVEKSMRLDPQRLLQWFAEERITLAFVATPMVEALLVEKTWPANLCLRALLTGGDVLHKPPGSPIPFALVNHYGPTENTVVTTWVPVATDTNPQAAPPPIGRPIANTQVYLLDRWFQPVPIGVAGELFIGGESLAHGYLHQPDLTAERFLPDPFSSVPGSRLYASGDLARWTSHGVLEFVGRRDHQVKIRGYRIELGEIEAVLHEHPDVELAAVTACEDVSGSKRLVGYVVPHPAESSVEEEHVRQWQILYDETYEKPSSHSDASFNITGWNSSYTGLPLPEADMREWVEGTVARILALRPQRILEIGCGTGLLLFRLAPSCKDYVGTDFSAAALDYLRPHAAALSHVRLLQRMAHEFSDLEHGGFDVVILNSVVQYFPGIDYLRRVLEGAAGMLRPGGSIFVGDVRSLPLLEAFHATVQLHQGPATLSSDLFRQRAQLHMRQEEELVVDPAFFVALQEHLRMGRVEIWPKRGHQSNELTQFRYDVCLHLDASPSANHPSWREWGEDALSFGELRGLLERQRPDVLGLAAVPNARLWATRETLAWMAGETERPDLGALRDALAEQRVLGGLDPEALWILGEELGYRVDISWARCGADGSFDLLLRRAGSEGEHSAAIFPPANSDRKPWRQCANDPLRAQKARMLPVALRHHMERRLPEHMIPSVFVVLESLPQTPSGKIDRHALPSPDFSGVRSSSTYVAPRTAVERQVAEIWEDLLAIDRIGVHDNFFELGGHSLLATQLVSRVRQSLDVALPVRVVFDEPTVAGIARSIGAAGQPGGEALPIPLASRETGPSLSFVQERVWISHQLVQAGATGSIGGAMRIVGPLDETALRRSIAEIMRRHEVLRTAFRKSGESIVLSLEEEVERVWSSLDLRGVAAEVRQAEALRVAREEVNRGFALSAGPLLRVTLVRVDETESLLVLTTHHVAFDGWSVGVLFRELELLYGPYSQGKASPLPPLPIQYADYAAWQRIRSEGPELQQQLAYWRNRLAGPLPVLDLPLDHSRPAEPTLRGAALGWTLPTDVSQALAELSRQEGVTLFMTLLAGFQALLHGATGQHDIVLGSPVANRSRVETEGLIGCFMQPLVLRTDLSGNPEFRELLGRVREVCLGAYANQEVPFELVVRALHPQWDGSRLPLFQVLFNMQRVEQMSLRLPGLTLSPIELESTTSSLDLSVHMLVHGTEIRGLFEYRTELFEASTIEWLGARYRSLLAAAAVGPGRRLSELWRANRSVPRPSGDVMARNDELSPERRELQALLLAEEQQQESAAELVRQPRMDAPCPASFGQERLWFYEQLEPDSALFNESAALRLDGPLDAEVLERSWQELARRHEAFRTSFFMSEDGHLKQMISSTVKVPIPRVDLTMLSDAEQQAGLQTLMEAEVEKPFDLTQAPLLRMVLLRVGREQHVLVVTAHHIIADGWSAEVWQSDLAAVYDAFLDGRPSPLPELGVQYVDYAAWQRKRLREPWVHEQLAYWKRQLGGELPWMELPVDRKRGTGKKRGRGATHAFKIPAPVHQKLRELGKRQGSTQFMTLLAAFQTLLYRYTGEDDILVDTVMAGRSREELAPLVGFFVNSVILRTYLSGNPTFTELLARVKRVCLDALEYQDVPFDRVVSALRVERKAFGGTLTPVSFMLHEALTKPREMGGGVRLVPAAFQMNDEFDLTMFLWQGAEGLTGHLKYDRELFDRETIERMAKHFVTLLEMVVAEPEVRLDQIAMLAEDERRELVHGWNQTREDVGEWQCVHERFEAKAEECAEAIAVQLSRGMREDAKEYQLSYGELDWRANQLARYLVKQGVKIETRVGLCVGRSLELAVGVLGILKSGGAYVPVDLSQPRERLRTLIENSGMTVVVTREAERRKLGDLVSGLTVVEFEEAREESGSSLKVGVSGQNTVYVIYTSGSTGKPKGVVVSHASVVNHNVAVTRRFGLEAADRVLQFHTVAFDAAIEELFPTWGVGAAVVMKGEELVSPGAELEKLITEERLTVLNLPTAYWHEWVAEGARRKLIAAKGLRLVIVGGDKVSAERYAMWKALTGGTIRWVNTYGPTETTVISSLWEPDDRDLGEVSGGISIGRPIANTRMYVLDSRMEPVPVGVGGELWIGGWGLARGYLGQPDLTAERFVADPFVEAEGARMYRTGDRARYKPDGRLEFLGRVDEQVKIRGFRVEPAEIESVLLKHPRVDKAVVTGRKASDTETRLVAYVVPATNDATDSDFTSQLEADRVATPDSPQSSLVSQLRSYLQGALPDYMAPSAIVLLDSIPMTAGGKVNRRQLPEPEPVPSERAGFVPPRTQAEDVLAKIWAEALGVERVGVHDNFFELGGDSLLGVRIIARANSAGLALSPKQIFQCQTIAKLASAAEDVRLPRLRPTERAARVPLSFAQEGFWFIDQLQPGVPFNIPIAIRLEGHLDIDALESALNALITRHEVLRTTFSEVDGQPAQVIAPSQRVSITTVSIPAGDDTERMSELLKQVITSARAPFDLSCGPLLRMTVFQLDAEDHVMMFAVHHSVFDGWSGTLFARELAAHYTSVVSGTDVALPDLPVQYADYAVWQREVLQGEFLESQLRYWTKQLAHHPTGLSLPTDRPESTAQLFPGEVVSLRLSGTLSDGLRALGRNEGCTMFMVLLAAYKVLLARYSGQDDIVVGTPVANRDQPELEHLIGACINVLALRTDLSGNPSFRQLVQKVREVCIGAYTHQDLPFGLLVQRLHPDRHLTRSPIFQVQFALQTVKSGFSLPGFRVSSLLDAGSLSQELKDLMIGATPATDHLFLQTSDLGTEITAEMQYRSDLFDAGTIQRLMRHLQMLLEGVVADPDRPVFEIPMLETEELRQLLVDWNPQERPAAHGILVHQLFEAEAERVPDAVAVIVPSPGSQQTGEQRLTYRELNQRANQLAHVLRSHGAGPEVCVGICLERSQEMIVAVLGVLKAGAAYVPLDPTYPDERLQYMTADAQIRLLLTRKGLIASPAAEGVQTIEWDFPREVLDEAGDGNPDVSVDDEHLAYVVYTSGSTGRPKGVMVSHRSLVSAYRAWEDAYDLRAMRCHLQMASFSFDVFAGDWIRALCSGGTLVLCPRDALLAPADLYRLLVVHGVDCAEFVPAVMRPLVEYLGQSGQTLDFMKRIVVGSDSWSCREYEQVQKLAGPVARVTNSYGAAEATIDSAYLDSLSSELSGDRSVPIGRPFANTQIYVLDQQLQPVPIGVAGGLHIAGAGLARGYLNRPDLTAEKFVPNPFSSESGARLYRTGDRARFLPDGNIEFLGRFDDQIKIRGFRVEVGEIEAVLSEHPAVREAVVVGCDEPAGDKSILAYAVVHPDTDVNAGTLRRFLERQLPHYMVPSAVIVLDGFPLTPSGKVDRRRLPTPTGQRPELTETYVAPRSLTERKLAHIWSEELRIDRVGIQDNFFALGGHSLLAAKVVSRVGKDLLIDLPLRELFLHPTVGGLAQAVDLALATGRTTAIDDLDLEREAELDISIAPHEHRFQFPTEVTGVFLTGATGFIGAYLLRELLAGTHADVYCLVRATSRDHGLKRLRDALEKYDLWEEATSTRIVPVVGDLCEPMLGLTDEQYSGLARCVDIIYHNAAAVNAVYPYAMLKPTNVLGTQEVLRLACEAKIKPVHYVSTIGVFPADRIASGAIDETWPADGCGLLKGGYNRSKWVAERLISIAAERGLPAAIYRPGMVAGDSRTGMWKPDQILIESLQTVLELGSVPRVSDDVPFDLVPVDYVARAIVCLSGQPESLGKAFHLVNPQPISWREFIARFGDLGAPLQELEPEHWFAELLRFARSTPTSFLNPLVPMLSQGLPARLANIEGTAPHPAGVPGMSDTGFSAGKTGTRISLPPIDCTNTLRGLKASLVTCTPAGELLDLHLSYFVRSGVLIARGDDGAIFDGRARGA